MTKEELQIQSLPLIKRSNRVALQWCTGLGKSKMAIDRKPENDGKGCTLLH